MLAFGTLAVSILMVAGGVVLFETVAAVAADGILLLLPKTSFHRTLPKGRFKEEEVGLGLIQPFINAGQAGLNRVEVTLEMGHEWLENAVVQQ
jgi:hypothetical protein